jgi:hypothetical protein
MGFGNNVTRHWSFSVGTSSNGSGSSGRGGGDVLVAATVVTVTAVSAVQLLTSANPLGRCYRFWKQLNRQEDTMTCSADGTVATGINDYSKLHFRSGRRKRFNNQSINK